MIRISSLYGLENISDSYYVDYSGEIFNRNGYRKQQTLGKRGYFYVSLNEKVTNRQVKVPVHKIIALAFIKNQPYNVINHKDGNKLNNKINNLEFCTSKENTEHAWKLGLICRKERIFKLLFTDGSYLTGTIKELVSKSKIPKATLYDLFYQNKGSKKHSIISISEIINNKGLETIETVNHA